MKKFLKFILVLIWMIIIFSFSSQNGTLSSNTSGGIIDQILGLLEKFGIIFSDNTVSLFGFIIRKIAHFSLYFILGILWMSFFKEYSISLKKQLIYSIILCVIYACSDEFHQLFVEGRDGKLLDVLIDTIGSLSSILFIYLFRNNKKVK